MVTSTANEGAREGKVRRAGVNSDMVSVVGVKEETNTVDGAE